MKKKAIGLIDGQSGNIGSIKKAIKDIIKDKPYQLKIIQSQFDPNQFSKIILPGQGAYATLISNLKKLKIFNSLKMYLENNFPYLGICVGMQILSDVGYEDKTTKGLGIINGEIKKFEKKTGIGGILNTSFNLSGFPNVSTPNDAVETILNSGLNCLVLENYVLLKKK